MGHVGFYEGFVVVDGAEESFAALLLLLQTEAHLTHGLLVLVEVLGAHSATFLAIFLAV